MHVKFKTITVTRFRSFLGTSTFQLDRGPGLFFLKGDNRLEGELGSNDAGKSTILKAFKWCLFGVADGLKNPDIIPWTGKGTTEVAVLAEVDGSDHIIKRTAAPNLLTIDGKEAGQAYVDELIRIPPRIIPYTLIMGQRQDLFFDLTPAPKLQIFTECLDLERWDRRSKKAAELSSALDRELCDIERSLADYKSKAEHVTETLKIWKTKSREWESERVGALKHHDKDKANITSLLASATSVRDKADLDLDRAETEIRGSNLNKLHMDYNDVQLEISKIENLLKGATRDLAIAETSLDKLSGSVCPTCQQPLNTGTHRSLLKDAKDRIKTLKSQIGQHKADIEKKVARQSKLGEAFKIEKVAYDQFKLNAANARDSLLRASREVSEFEAQLKSLGRRIEDYETKDNPFNEEIKKFRKQLSDTNGAIQDAENSVNEKTAQYNRALYWVRGFNDIKLYTLTEVLQELEIVTNSLLSEFYLDGWSVRYDVERENKSGTVARGLNIEILSPRNSKPVKWEVWGGGVSQRLRLAGTVALSSVLLNHVGVSTNLMILDEPTQGLSSQGAQDLIKMLAQRAADASQSIWLIDHLSRPTASFAGEVTIIKDQRGSYIDGQ